MQYVSFYDPPHACLLEFCGLFPFIPLMTSLKECALQMKCTLVMLTVTELKRSSFSSSKQRGNHQLLGCNLTILICLFVSVVVDFNQCFLRFFF